MHRGFWGLRMFDVWGFRDQRSLEFRAGDDSDHDTLTYRASYCQFDSRSAGF